MDGLHASLVIEVEEFGLVDRNNRRFVFHFQANRGLAKIDFVFFEAWYLTEQYFGEATELFRHNTIEIILSVASRFDQTTRLEQC